ncbi:hypothetical protein PHISP_03643 [Aspergillus sp. HF37]|nr:hypothetical protein PHISP_03643 [Aspergillus sp. HF37]
MAPRRGGSGGFDIDVDTSDCAADAFSTTSSRVRIAFYALFTVVYAVLTFLAATSFLRSKRKGKALLQWWALGGSILLGLLSLILSIILVALIQCEVAGDISDAMRANIAITWLYSVSVYLMIAVIMVPIVRHLYMATGKIAKLVTIVNVVYLALLAIILVCWLAIYTFITHSQHTGDYDYFIDLHRHRSRIAVAYYAMEAFGVLIAGTMMLILLVRHSSLWRWTLKAQVLFLIVAALGLTLTNMASSADVYFGSHDVNYLNKSINASLFIQLLFYSCTFAVALFIASSPHLSDANRAYPPVGTAMPPQQQATYHNPPVVPELYSPQK